MSRIIRKLISTFLVVEKEVQEYRCNTISVNGAMLAGVHKNRILRGQGLLAMTPNPQRRLQTKMI